MSTIASLDILFKASTAGLAAGCKKAGSIVDGFVDKAGSKLGEIGLGKLTAGFAALAAVGAGAFKFFESLDKIDRLGDVAQQIGVTTEALSELRHAANLTGSNAEDLDAALLKMNQNLGDAALKANPTSEALERMGVDLKSLAGLSPDRQFLKIADGFARIPGSAARASTAMDVFGKGGVKVLNTLGSGGQQLRDLAEEARRLGVSISQVDHAKVAAAKDSIDRANAAVEGLTNTLAIALAPAIAAAADEMVALFASAEAGSSRTQAVLDQMVVGMAFVADAAEAVSVAFQWAGNGITAVLGNLVSQLGDIGSLLSGLLPGVDNFGARLAQSVHDFGDGMVKEAEKAGKALHAGLAGASPGQKILEKYDAFKNKVNEAAAATAKAARDSAGGVSASVALASSIHDLTEKLQGQVAAFGKGPGTLELYKLAQQGATESQLASAKALTMQLEGLEQSKKDYDELKGFAKGFWESSRTAAEKYEIEVGRANAALAAGLIDQATFDRSKKKAAKDRDGEVKFAGALQLGSAEARSSVLQATSGRGANGVEKATREVAGNTARTVQILDKLSARLTLGVQVLSLI